MSDQDTRSTEHLDAETLAAFLDGRVDAAERARIEGHLAECEACYEVFVDATAVMGEMGSEAAESASAPTAPVLATVPSPAPLPRRRPTWIYAGIGFAAAAVVVFGLLLRSSRSPVDTAIDDLVRTVGTARFSEARLSPDFPFGAPPSATRGPESKPSTAIQQSALRLIALAESHRSASTLHAAGLGHLALGDVDAAIAALDESAALDPNDTATFTDLSAALLQRWRQRSVTSDAARALDEVEQAGRLRPASPAVLFNRALCQEALGSVDAAIKTWRDYLAVDGASNWATEARAHLTKLQGRLSATTEASSLYRALNRNVLEPWATAVLAGGVFRLQEGQSIADGLRKSARDLYLPDLLASAAASAGWPSATRLCLAHAILAMRDSRDRFDESDYESAQRLAADAEQKFSCARTPTSDARMQQAWSLFFRDHRAEAVRQADAIVSDADQRHYYRLLARAEYMHGFKEVGEARFSEGLIAYGKALALSEQAADAEQLAATHAMLTEAFRNLGDPDTAWMNIGQALSNLQFVRSQRLQYFVLSSAQIQAMSDGYLHAALVFSRELIPVVEAWAQPVTYVDTYSLNARLLAQLGLASEAMTSAKRARERLAQLPDIAVRNQYDADIGWAESLALQHTDPQASVAALTPEIERISRVGAPRAIANVMLLRGQALLAAGRAQDAVADWIRGIDALEEQREGIQTEQLRISRASQLWDLYGDLIAAKRDNPAAALLIAERARSRSLLDLLATKGVTPPLAPDDLHHWLPTDTRALVYAVLPTEVIGWSVTRDGVAQFSHAMTPAKLEGLVRDFVADLRAGRPTTDRQLRDVLLPPDLDARPESLLAILPDGPLHALPFAVLSNPRSGRRLLDDFLVAVEPSLTLLRRDLETPRPTSQSALLVGYGAAQPGLGLASLPEIAAEIDDLHAINPSAVRLVGLTATRATILKALSAATIIHFAGHALANEVHPWQAQLFVAPDAQGGALTPDDIAAVMLPRGAVVILSACEGAHGRVFRGEGLMSLVRPFLAAGAVEVLASLWPVADSDARAIVTDVHRELRAGHGLVRALATVQRKAANAGNAAGRWAGWTTFGADESRGVQR